MRLLLIQKQKKLYWTKKHKQSEFKIIEVNYTNKLTEKFNEIAQWGVEIG